MTDLDRLCWIEEAWMRRRLEQDDKNAERLAAWHAQLGKAAQSFPPAVRSEPVVASAKVTPMKKRVAA